MEGEKSARYSLFLIGKLYEQNCLFPSLPIYVPTDDWNAVFGKVSIKGRLSILEGGDILFIGGTVARDDCCPRVAVKCSTYHSSFDSLYTI